MRVHRKLVRAARAVARVASAPPLVGALLVLGLASWAGQRTTGDDADLGDLRRADAVASFVEHRFAAEITRMKIGILATALALGLIVGLIAELLIRARHAARRPPRPTQRATARGFLETVLVCLAVHAAFVMWAMADSPQLYAARWYATGGLARTTQILATDLLGPRGVLVASFAAALLYIRPTRLTYLLRRTLGSTKRTLRAATLRAPAPALALLIAITALSPPDPLPPIPTPIPTPTPTPTHRPNILILAADSLRADRLTPRTAPTLSLLASRATRFDHAHVSLPRTFPSWVTLLTGRHPHHHGLRSMFPTWEDRARDFDALPTRLARAGYQTAVVSDYAGDIFGRIDLGFQRVQAPTFDFRQLIRQRALERETPLLPLLHSQLGRRLFPVMRELNDAADPRLLADDVRVALHAMKASPFFLTVFFSTAHFPYAAPAPYYAKFTDPAYRGRFKYHKPVGLGADAPPDAADIRQIQALYDGSVNAIDDAVARVLASLESEGLADDTIVVVTADHGEMLYDHGHGQGHGDHLFGDEVTHVPLVVYDPRVAKPDGALAGLRAQGIARDVDLAPTLYELAGVPGPADMDGRSLVPALRGQPIEPRFAYAESELWFTEEITGLSPELRMSYPGIVALTEIDTRHNAEIVLRSEMLPLTTMARHRMIRDDRFKLVYVPTRKGVKYMLFDTVADPDESRDVSASQPEVLAHLRAELWAWMLRDPQMEQKDGFLVPRDPASMSRPRAARPGPTP